MIENPYFFRGPVTDEAYFFGREQETRRLLRALRGGQSVSIVGPRRIGKSSLLVHIQSERARASHHLGNRFALLYVDCQESAGWNKNDFYRRLCDETERRLGIYSTIASRRSTTFADFSRTVNDAVEQDFHLIFLFDEFEVMAANRNLDAGFFSQLRGFVGRKVSFVTASQTDLYALTRAGRTALSSPFFNSFYTMNLGLFKRPEALQLITELSQRHGLKFSPKTVSYLLHVAGTHPFFLQIACDAAFEYQALQPKLANSDYVALTEEIQQQLEPHFKYYWHNLSAEERQTLVDLSAGNATAHLKPYLVKLEKQCLITRYNGGYRFVSASFAHFVREQGQTVAFPTPEPAGSAPVAQAAQSQNTRALSSRSRSVTLVKTPSPFLSLRGSRLGPYELLEKIGVGGMAAVYKAYQRSLDRHVAVKVLETRTVRDAEAYRRFAQEAQAIAGLVHRNILPIYEFGQQDGLAYIAMQYVENGTLRDKIKKGLLRRIDIPEMFDQVCQALHYAHKRGIVHRDVKPANILIAEGNWALLADFGLVKMLESSAQITHSGYTVGTPYYMSPEQVRGLEIDHRSDIYSLGAVLYEAVTKRPPFAGQDALDVLVMKKKGAQPLLPREIVPTIPKGLERLILKAMAVQPEDRYQSVLEMNAALQSLR